MRTIRRILVAVKNPGAKVLPGIEKAAQLALAFGAEVELFHAISGPRYLGYDELAAPYLAEIERTQRVQFRRHSSAQ
jgi:hypothetical protein